MATPDQFAELAALFPVEPFSVRGRLLDLLASEPKEALSAAMAFLVRDGASPGGQMLLRLLMWKAMLAEALCDFDRCALEDAVTVTRLAVQIDRGFARKLAGQLEICNPDDLQSAMRMLDLLAALGDEASLRVLAEFLRHPVPALRSKAVFLLTRAGGRPSWIRELGRDSDARVRANLVEGLWNSASEPSAVGVFRAFTTDSHPRVAANAWVGLHFAGEENAAEGLLEMARHPDPAFRLSAVWAMGATGDARFRDFLAETARTQTGKLRVRALRALARPRTSPANPASAA